jgi:extracellular factor (EF) 3-hydroxypalmitic acid methyl ester biosynthesis protein
MLDLGAGIMSPFDHSAPIELVPSHANRERPKRAKRMRARRLRLRELHLEMVQARFVHTKLGELEAAVEDLSLHGMALVIDGAAARGELLLAGDRLQDITLWCQTSPLYQGSGTVRRIEERGPDLVLGIALDTSGVDLGQLYRQGTRNDFANRWQRVTRQADAAHIAPAFRVWVNDLRVMLAATQTFLDTEEHALRNEDVQTAAIACREYLDVVVPDMKARIEEARARLAELVGDLSPAEHVAYRAYCAVELNPYLKQSPFLRRALEKPLGYAGDYEMMNMLYRNPLEGESLLGKALNVCFTEEPAAVANKNRISYIGKLIRRRVGERPVDRVRVASLGCGPSREIEALLSESPELGPRLEIALIDQEERAIAHCERTLAPLAARTGARVHFIRESLRTLLTRERLSQKLGRCDLIYSAGLFDYLDDRLFERILSVLYEALADRGMLAIGNVAAHNPSRWLMEYFADWFLIHRTPEQLLGLARELSPEPAQATVDAEPSGVNLFLQIRRS